MHRRLAALATLLLTAGPLRAQACPTEPLALVLAGGGAKGFAHIGVLFTLDRLKLRPDLPRRSIPWSGTSRSKTSPGR
jgi:predicted acylesterase/phospholipase RssA